MYKKLVELHQLLSDADNNALPSQSQSPNRRIQELVNEILDVLGLPLNQGYEDILLWLGAVNMVDDSDFDAAMIKLADEAVYYRLVADLSSIKGSS
jgi:hypothetical protein